jgi:hypothetical protein
MNAAITNAATASTATSAGVEIAPDRFLEVTKERAR